MQTWILSTLGIVILAAIIVCFEIYRELHCFKNVIYKIETDKIKKESGTLKIVFLSDLHNHEYGNNNEELIEAVKKAAPDYIFIGGDMLVGRRGKHVYEKAALLVEKITEIAPVYYANGNHEQRMHEQVERYGTAFREYKTRLENAGVNWLLNDSVVLNWKNEKIKLSGVEIPMDCYRRPRKHWLTLEDVEERIGDSSKNSYQILLAHHPDYAKVYKEWGADLILSGHLHGGIARLPILGGVISPQAGLFPKYSGDCYDIGDSKIVVSKGLGTHTVNIRFLNPAELIILHIDGKM